MERCEWCAKGNLPNTGIHFFVIDGEVSYGTEVCTAPSPEAVIEELAGKMLAIRAEVENVQHEAGCAAHKCAVRGCFGSSIAHYEDHSRVPKPCDCARGRALKLAGGQDA